MERRTSSRGRSCSSPRRSKVSSPRSRRLATSSLPRNCSGSDDVASLRLRGDETFDLLGLETLRPRLEVQLVVHRADGSTDTVPLTLRIDTPIEVDYSHHGGILPFVLRQLLAA